MNREERPRVASEKTRGEFLQAGMIAPSEICTGEAGQTTCGDGGLLLPG